MTAQHHHNAPLHQPKVDSTRQQSDDSTHDLSQAAPLELVEQFTRGAKSSISSGVLQLQRLVGNHAVIRMLAGNARRLQRQTVLEGEFGNNGSVHHNAYTAFLNADAAPLTPGEQNQYQQNGAAQHLNTPLLNRIAALANTDLYFTNGGAGTTFGSTVIYAELAPAADANGPREWKGLSINDHQALNNELAGAPQNTRFRIKIVVRNWNSKTEGKIVQIINHELSIHGENLLSLITSVQAGQALAQLPTEVEEHAGLVNKTNQRYHLIRERYLAANGGDAQGYRERETLDANGATGNVGNLLNQVGQTRWWND